MSSLALPSTHIAGPLRFSSYDRTASSDFILNMSSFRGAADFGSTWSLTIRQHHTLNISTFYSSLLRGTGYCLVDHRPSALSRFIDFMLPGSIPLRCIFTIYPRTARFRHISLTPNSTHARTCGLHVVTQCIITFIIEYQLLRMLSVMSVLSEEVNHAGQLLICPSGTSLLIPHSKDIK